MKTIQQLLILLLIGCACNQPIQASDFTFIQNNLEEAKRQAAQEGKLIMVDFWAIEHVVAQHWQIGRVIGDCRHYQAVANILWPLMVAVHR